MCQTLFRWVYIYLKKMYEIYSLYGCVFVVMILTFLL